MNPFAGGGINGICSMFVKHKCKIIENVYILVSAPDSWYRTLKILVIS